MRPLSWTFENQPDYLVLRAEGEWLYRSIRKIIDEIRDHCRAAGYDRVLCDLRGIVGFVADEERHRAGVEVAETLRGIMMAVVVPEQYPSRLAEQVANRRGAKMLITMDVAEAHDWLLRAV